MGRLLKGTHSGAAILLTSAAVLIPCVAWYWMGTKQLEHVTGEMRQGAMREATTTAMQLAAKLALQLDDLRRAEGERSYLEYFPRYMARGERCEKLHLRTSPLAKGEYPLAVLFYFQMDENGQVRSPRGGEDVASLQVPQRGRNGRVVPPAFDPPLGKSGAASSIIPSGVRPWHIAAAEGLSLPPESLAPAGVAHNRPDAPVTPTDSMSSLLFDSTDGLPASDEQHELGEFRWMTGRWRGEPTLMAIRQLRRKEGTYQQGFAIESRSLSDWMFNGGFPARLLPGPAITKTAAMLPLGSVDWHVQFDPESALATVARQEATLRNQFRYSYFGGLFGALLAGACVVALVSRSGRLARERSRFAAAAAHELRTPLAGIRLHGEMLAASLGNPASIQRYAQRITDEAERLGRVVANVLSYTRDDQRRTQVHRQLGNIAETVHICLANIEPLLRESGAVLVVDVPDDLPQMAFDADAIHQMLRNLIDNAEKYTRRSADRRIEVEVAPVLDGHDDDRSVRLVVRDHGPGIDESLKSRLFQPFVNADTPGKHAGLGLGLSVVHGLVTAHGGTIAYSGTAGGGATFTITLPG